MGKFTFIATLTLVLFFGIQPDLQAAERVNQDLIQLNLLPGGGNGGGNGNGWGPVNVHAGSNIAPGIIMVVLREAAPQFGVTYDDLLAKYNGCQCAVVKKGPRTYQVTLNIGGGGSVLVTLGNF